MNRIGESICIRRIQMISAVCLFYSFFLFLFLLAWLRCFYVWKAQEISCQYEVYGPWYVILLKCRIDCIHTKHHSLFSSPNFLVQRSDSLTNRRSTCIPRIHQDTERGWSNVSISATFTSHFRSTLSSLGRNGGIVDYLEDEVYLGIVCTVFAP